MVLLEWSPGENIVRKLERLGYALVRTRPVKEVTCERRPNSVLEKLKIFTGPLAISLLVAMPYVADNSSSAIILMSILLSSFDAAITVWCYTDFECKHGQCSGDIFICMFNWIGEFPSFLIGWFTVCAFSSGFALCARSVSEIMDAVSGHHVQSLVENILGSFAPLGAPVDILASGVTIVPIIMCSLGMEESILMRSGVYMFTLVTLCSMLGSAMSSKQTIQTDEESVTQGSLQTTYSKIISAACMTSSSFFGVLSLCKPENMKISHIPNFNVSKKVSKSGCLLSIFFLAIIILQSIMFNKSQQTNRIWDGDPPLLWALEPRWRIVVASFGVMALSLATFEFLIPLCKAVTVMANEGLLYGKLKKDPFEDSLNWNPITPLVFGGVASLQALLLDPKVNMCLVAASAMCISIIICCSMLVSRYQPASLQVKQNVSHVNHRRFSHVNSRQGAQNQKNSLYGNVKNEVQKLRTVKFLKNGLQTFSSDFKSSSADPENVPDDRKCLMEDSADHGDPRHESVSEFSTESNVSGYESGSHHGDSDATDETDIDAIVTEYEERIRVATLKGLLPQYPTTATSLRVTISTVVLVPCSLAFAASLSRASLHDITGLMLSISSGILLFLLLVVISRQPQYDISSRNRNSGSLVEQNRPRSCDCSFVPLLPAFGIFLHSAFLLESLDAASIPFSFWLSCGLIIYFSYGVSKSVAAPYLVVSSESLNFNFDMQRPVMSSMVCTSSDLQPSQSTSSSAACEPCVQIDTIFITA